VGAKLLPPSRSGQNPYRESTGVKPSRLCDPNPPLFSPFSRSKALCSAHLDNQLAASVHKLSGIDAMPNLSIELSLLSQSAEQPIPERQECVEVLVAMLVMEKMKVLDQAKPPSNQGCPQVPGLGVEMHHLVKLVPDEVMGHNERHKVERGYPVYKQQQKANADEDALVKDHRDEQPNVFPKRVVFPAETLVEVAVMTNGVVLGLRKREITLS
jgi:hypothetical protein